MSTIDLEILSSFLDEAEDILVEWEKVCLAIEKNHKSANYDSLFRAAHNMKGLSRTIGLTAFGNFIHGVEDLIAALKNGKISTSAETVAILFSAHQIISQWVTGLRGDADFNVPEATTKVVIDQIFKALEGGDPSNKVLFAEELITPEEIQKSVLAQNDNLRASVDPELLLKEVELTKALEEKETRDQEKQNKVKNADETIRISSQKLDQLLQMVGELSIQQTIVWHAKQKHNLGTEVCNNAIELCNKIVKEIQTQVLGLRMQPLTKLFQKLERAARDLSRDLNKPINIDLQGALVELDKTVIEKVTDSLRHIIRNALDHGVESPEVRESKGKSPTGLLKIQAIQDASGVSLIIQDDGKGLDKEKILQKALKEKLIHPDEAASLSEHEIFNFIFHPGFSTAEKVTDISGRGVGMDVVNRCVEELGGSISIQSKKDEGTCFVITLPTGLSIFEALIVSISNEKYVIPLNDLIEVIDLGNYEVKTCTEHGRIFSLRGEVVPIEYLSEYLVTIGHTSAAPNTKTSSIALISQLQKKKLALVIDKILGQQSVVVRQLQGQLADLAGIAGGTILGDGEPGMILHLPTIAKQFFKSITVKRQ